MKKIFGVIAIIGLGIIVYNSYKNSKKDLKKVEVKK